MSDDRGKRRRPNVQSDHARTFPIDPRLPRGPGRSGDLPPRPQRPQRPEPLHPAADDPDTLDVSPPVNPREGRRQQPDQALGPDWALPDNDGVARSGIVGREYTQPQRQDVDPYGPPPEGSPTHLVEYVAVEEEPAPIAVTPSRSGPQPDGYEAERREESGRGRFRFLLLALALLLVGGIAAWFVFVGSGDELAGVDEPSTLVATTTPDSEVSSSSVEEAELVAAEGGGDADAGLSTTTETATSTVDETSVADESTVPAAGGDPLAVRGLLEADRITLTGSVPSQGEVDSLVTQLETVVGVGNVNVEAITIDATVSPTEELTLSVADELGFRPGSDSIEASFFPVLDRIVGFLGLLPSVSVAVEGHTDSSGIDYENLALSQRRADAVVDYIVSAGVNSFRLEPQGRGSTEPVADNSTEAGRALNRRIEFVVFGLAL